MRGIARIVAVGILFFGAGMGAFAQENRGPLGPPPKFEAKRASNEPNAGAPPLPQEEIIKRFAANEDVMKNAYATYHFNESIRVEEMTDPGGQFTALGEVYTRPDGQRYLRVAKPPESNLKITAFSMEDVRTIASLPLFVLTSSEVGNYNFKYAGTDKLDELDTFVFQVKPKQLSRTRLFYDGVIWVDSHDFAVVKSFGQMVSEIPGEGVKLPFKMFEIYRENFQEKYWLPTYIRSEDTIPGPSGSQYELRLVIRASDFKLNPEQPAVAPSAPSGAAAPSTKAQTTTPATSSQSPPKPE
jgi:hypothetical protein